MSGVLGVRGLASERKVLDWREEEHVVWSHGGLEGELRVSCHVYPPFDTNLLFRLASTSFVFFGLGICRLSAGGRFLLLCKVIP